MNYKDKLARLLMYCMRVFPIKRNKIVVDNFNGKGYGENPKYVVNTLLKQDKEYDIVWIVEDTENCELPNGIRKVKLHSVQYFYELVTAKVWIDNVRKPVYTIKRKSQCYIQLWHGEVALKKIEADVQSELTKKYVQAAKNDSKITDIILSSSRTFSKLVRRAFWYNGRIYESGAPRNDIFFEENKERIENIKEALGIAQDKKVILYAPTFRKDKKMNKLLEPKIVDICKERFGGEWVCLLRLHPNVISTMEHISNIDTMFNVSKYPDIQELLLVADVLVTDYSSTMFNFSLTKKPVFLYAYDLEEYRKDRNFYYEIEELPYPLACDDEELYGTIREFDEVSYQENIQKFIDEIELLEDGRAGERVVKLIEEVVWK